VMGATDSKLKKHSKAKSQELASLRSQIGRDKAIGEVLDSEQKEMRLEMKLLLLGAGESGKSTLFKQIVTLYGPGLSDEDRLKFSAVIHLNCIESMKVLVDTAEKLSADFKAQADLIRAHDQGAAVSRKIVEAFKVLWPLPQIQSAFEHRASHLIPDSFSHFVTRLDDIVRDDYVPSLEDALRVRVKTTGIIEQDFVMNASKFRLIDVGGQRSERKKWINCFHDVTGISL